MRRRTHKGQIIDMETLSQNNEKSIAMGNMGVNAKGDKIGPGGQVLQTSQQRTRQHYDAPIKTSSNVSIREKLEDETVFPEEKKGKNSKKPTIANAGGDVTNNGPSGKKAKKAQVEKETESGDIIMVDKDE